MPHHPSTSSSRLWRLLILDRDDPGDARWLLATIAEPGDVRPAGLADTAPGDLTRAWVGARHGAGATLTALPRARVWRVDEGGKPR
jgi:hypothetical protein